MNPWTQFLGLLPKPPKQVGTVVSHDANGRHQIELPSGSMVFAKSSGIYATGDKVFVTDGVIDGKAPNLAATTQNVGP